ncbi:PREDICTED: secretory immunoglobulin A-binding protein EsiB-like, partial [Priapulus caudatus]|uniref:Secretory immunoglobulin A-binding protein EsiB-like n=1 Tax=Priapulus caudatus TaxID=37621 RepID=A0ABM1F7I1_PRICU
MCYENGWGTAADLQQAAELYSKAANDGHIAATHSLGYFYEHGLGGLMANKSFAEELYKMAADLGDISAQLDLERLQAFEAIASDK